MRKMKPGSNGSRVGSPSAAGLYGAALTIAALIAFAANSIFCRMALSSQAIDPAGFTALRLASGALTLFLVVRLRNRNRTQRSPGSWISAIALYLYAVGFSFAYVSLNVGTGALIIFAAVQTTMIAAGLIRGERPHPLAWAGLIAASSGFVYLVLPGLESPSIGGTALMVTAGISWGVYSLRGFDVADPVAATADNFLRTLPFAAVTLIFLVSRLTVSLPGILLALLSGGLTSGIGYVIWYAALPALSATRAAAVQLLVPVLAAFGGILFLSEPVTLRLIVAALLMLGGIGLTLKFRS